MPLRLLTLALLLWAAPLAAQTTDTIVQNLRFQVAADHDGVNAEGIRLYQNGVVIQTKPVSAIVNGVITFDYPAGLPAGTYVFYAEAYSGTTAASSSTLTLTVTSPPPPPPPSDPCLTAAGAKGLVVNLKDYQKNVTAPGPGWVVFQVLDYLGKPITGVSALLTTGASIATVDPTLMANIRVWSGIWVRPPKAGSFSMFVRVTNVDGCAAESARVPLTVK